MGCVRPTGTRFQEAETKLGSSHPLQKNPNICLYLQGRSDSQITHTPDDRDRAASLLDEALAISNELAMRPLVERVVAIQNQVRDGPGEAPVYPDGLTPREWRCCASRRGAGPTVILLRR